VIFDSALEAVGHTPLIRLQRLTGPEDADIFVKLESVNIGGSVKTRVAAHMIAEAERQGQLGPDTIICEPTSGNQGIGLALVGAVKGYQVRIVMPDSVSQERRQIIAAYGAEVVLVPDHGDIGDCIQRCLATVEAFAAEDPRVFIPQQFSNPANPAIHRLGTGQEILDVLTGPIDGFCAGIGTGGTITGIGRLFREHFPDIQIWAIEPENAAILTGGVIGTHVQMGIGDGLIPDNLDTSVYDEVAVVTDAEAVATARALARQEGLLVGISSGTNVAAARRLARRLGPGKTVVTLCPDTGERYFSTPLYETSA
jgi:cysteine synthase A